MSFDRPYFPIIYVRGYAMTGADVEHTVADPYMGFNLGSTKLRQQYPKSVVRHVFESPLVRLMKDEGYRDTFVDGAELADGTALSPRTVRRRSSAAGIARKSNRTRRDFSTS